MKKIIPALLASLLLSPVVPAHAGVAEILRDTQRTTQANGDITMVMWMPQQFWEESMKGNPALTPEGRAQVLLSSIKPAMGAMGGAAMQGMEFVVYPAKADGKPLIDALQAGTLQVSLYDQVYRWRTPLGSLLPAKVDAKTGEEFPGNYSFNPFTGEKLTAR